MSKIKFTVILIITLFFSFGLRQAFEPSASNVSHNHKRENNNAETQKEETDYAVSVSSYRKPIQSESEQQINQESLLLMPVRKLFAVGFT